MESKSQDGGVNCQPEIQGADHAVLTRIQKPEIEEDYQGSSGLIKMCEN